MGLGLDLEFCEFRAAYEPNPFIGWLPSPGDRAPGRKFLTDLCLSAHRLPEEVDG